MSKIKKFINLFGDIAILYASLAIALFIRYQGENVQARFNDHLIPFSVIFIVWLAVFYLTDLYQSRYFNFNYQAFQRLLFSISLNVVISIILFYLFQAFFQLTPKTNLFIFAIVFAALDTLWRFILAKFYISSGWRNRLLVIGESSSIKEIIDHLKTNPQFGYDPIAVLEEFPKNNEIKKIILENKIDTVVVHSYLKKDQEIAKEIYRLLTLKISVIDSAAFFETIFQKVPLGDLEESWFIEKIPSRRPIYETAKRILDIMLSLILIIILLPIMALIIIAIKLTSRGPAVYKQNRTGLNNKPFVLYKFRTMIADHSGPLATMENDSRITPVGKYLRYTHLDEISQLFNILKGNISFTGPRAEASKLVETYSQLPYYDLRHIIKPGLTGWAQVNYKPSASLEEANEKLKYDIYYIKNRSLGLDFLILLKTIKYLFTSLT